jgi:hypothetical protein
MAYDYELTWQFDSNRSFTPANAAEITQYQIWYIASFLLGYIGGAASGLWTLEGCSDSVSANMSGTWLWGTPGVFDPTKIVQTTAAPTANPHSWVVLKRAMTSGTAGTCYLVLDAYHSSTAGFGMWTSTTAWSLAGTPTFSPTSATWTPALGAGFYNQQVNDATTGVHRINGALATNGNFHIWMARSGSTSIEFMMMWANAFMADGTDDYPYVQFRAYNATANQGWWTANPFYNASYPSNAARRQGGGTGFFNLEFLKMSTVVIGRELMSEQNAVYLMPYLVWCNDSGVNTHARGRVQDWAIDWHATQTLPNGWVLRDSGDTIRYMHHGGVFVPYDTTPLL